MSTALPQPDETAALIRAYIARHAWHRRVKLALAGELQHLAGVLLIEADTHSRVIGRLRRDAAHYEHDAELVRRQRRSERLTIASNKPELREAA